jgi:hypothetical protein
MTDDLTYYRTRAARERVAAERQAHPAARSAHLAMAEHYERLVTARAPNARAAA